MSPQDLWRAADAARDDDFTARALGFDKAKLPHAWYALLPFVLVDTDDGPCVAASTEPLMPYTESTTTPFWHRLPDGRVVDLETMVAMNDSTLIIGENVHWAMPPETATIFALRDGRVGFLGERLTPRMDAPAAPPSALYVPPQRNDEPVQLFTDGATFFRAWVAQRVRWMEDRRKVRRDSLAELAERADGCVPGALLIGDAGEVHWPLERTFIAPNGKVARAINDAIATQSHLSRAIVAPSAVRKAA